MKGWRTLALAGLGFVAVYVAMSARSQAPAEGDQPAAARPARPQGTVGPDGTIALTSPDGTTRRVPAAALGEAASQSAGSGEPAGEDPLMPVLPPPWLKDAATNQAFLGAMTEYYAYKGSGLQHRRRVFEWQLFSSKIIFTAVLLLVASGITFAAIQFRAGLARTTTDARDAATEIDLTTTSVKVSSPVLGVIILVISLAFFYLYLVYVYPISELV